MAKKDSEQKRVLNLDGKEYVIEDMTNDQKAILEDINNYQTQINRLDRWKAGQINVLRESLKLEEAEAEV